MKTLREEIADAIQTGLGDQFVRLEEHDNATDVHTTIDNEPITIWRDEINVPEPYGDAIRSGIALDVRAILAEDQARGEAMFDQVVEAPQVPAQGITRHFVREYRLSWGGVVLGLVIVALLIVILIAVAR